jgi:hypothetical protein
MGIRRSRKLLLLAAAAIVVAAAGIATNVVANAATTGCQVRYDATAETPETFSATVSVENFGTAISPWALRWSFAAGQQITDGWNGTFSQSADAVTVTNARRVTELRTNRRISFGFRATWTTENPVPENFTLNGLLCTDRGTSTSASPSVSSSASGASDAKASTSALPADLLPASNAPGSAPPPSRVATSGAPAGPPSTASAP